MTADKATKPLSCCMVPAGVTGWANFGNIDPLVEAGYRVILLDCPGWGKNIRSLIVVRDRILMHESEKRGGSTGYRQIHLLDDSMGAIVLCVHKWRARRQTGADGRRYGRHGLFTPMPTEGDKRLNPLSSADYRKPKLMMDIFVLIPAI